MFGNLEVEGCAREFGCDEEHEPTTERTVSYKGRAERRVVEPYLFNDDAIA